MKPVKGLAFNLPESVTRELGLHDEPGYLGTFTRKNVPGAIPAGTRIKKVKTEPGDLQLNGSLGTVLGSLQPPGQPIMYFIEWDNRLRLAVSVIDWKVERA